MSQLAIFIGVLKVETFTELGYSSSHLLWLEHRCNQESETKEQFKVSVENYVISYPLLFSDKITQKHNQDNICRVKTELSLQLAHAIDGDTSKLNMNILYAQSEENGN